MSAPRDPGSGGDSQRSVATDDALRLIEAHCRYTTTILPRGVVGVDAALEYLHHLPAACRRMLPDLTGSAPKFAASAVRLGLLATTPSDKVARSVPRLISAVSPMIEPRTPRIWTWWIVRLLDADMQAKLRSRTPRSQLEMAADPAPEPGISRRELRRRLADLGGEIERLTTERDQLTADKGALVIELEATRRRAADDEARVELLLQARDQTIAQLQADLIPRLHKLDSALRPALKLKAMLEQDPQLLSRLTEENAEIEQLQVRLARWQAPTLMLLPAADDQKPGWHAAAAGRKYRIYVGADWLGAYELDLETSDAPPRAYTGQLSQVVLFAHLVHAGEAEEEARKIARVTRKRTHP
jgi:hypothetical protein